MSNDYYNDERSFFARIPKRYILSALGFLGFANLYALRVNFSSGLRAAEEDGVLADISPTTQGYLLSSFFAGYIVTQIPGGWLSRRLGGKWPFGVGIAGTAILAVLTPATMKMGPLHTIVLRILMGMFEGLNYPAMHELWSHWAPPMERSKLVCLSYSGAYFGTVMANLFSGYIAASFGWSYIFYFYSGAGLVWTALWFGLVYDRPRHHPTISEEERNEIEVSIGYSAEASKHKPIPWMAILTSAPVWAIITAHVVQNWGFYTLLTELPFFFKNIYNWNVAEAGLASSLPYIAMMVMLVAAGLAIDWLRDEKRANTTILRKTAVCSSFTGVALLYISAVYSTTYGTSFTCIVGAVGLCGISAAAFIVNHIDIAPQYAGILMGITNTAATLPGIISPIIVGDIVKTGSFEEWQTVFYIAAVIYVVGAIVYGTFASSDLQDWAYEDADDTQPVQGAL
jgi:ACS family sodium-dependent inorganic phosphate cotransporter